MSKKNKTISGYQVRTADLKGISFEDHSVEKCKKYCYNGRVVVSTYRKRFAFKISLLVGPKHYWFHYSKYGRCIDILWLSIRWEWLTINEPLEIVWRNEEE